MSTLSVRKQSLQATITPSTYDADKHTVEVVFATETEKVRRFDWRNNRYFVEKLSLNPEHISLERMNAGAPVLDNHSNWSIRSVLGKVESAKIENKQAIALVRFDQNSEDAKLAEAQVRDGIITRVSCGYSVSKYLMEENANANELPIYRAISWEPAEISFVPVPADIDAAVRSQAKETEYEVTVEGETEPTQPTTEVRSYEVERNRLKLRNRLLY